MGLHVLLLTMVFQDWNRTIDVLSAAIPSLAFHEVVLADGTMSETPLGIGAHPVGVGFDLAWEVKALDLAS